MTDKLHSLITNDQLEEVIALLQDGNNWIPDMAKARMTDIAQKWRQLRQQEVRGLISEKKASYEKKAIKKLILQLVEYYFKSPEEKLKALWREKLWWMLLIGLIFMFLVVLSCIWLSQ